MFDRLATWWLQRRGYLVMPARSNFRYEATDPGWSSERLEGRA